MERSVRNIVLAVFVGLSASAFAQSEGGLLLGVEAEKKIDKKLSVSVEAEMRTRNNFKTMDRWKFGISGSYKFTKWLKADVGYDLLNDNNREKKEYYTSSSGKYVKIHWRPGYWGVKHRFHASLTGSVKIADFKLSLRERWRYTYRPEKTTRRYDFDNGYWEDTNVKSKNLHILRSRFKVDWDIPNCKIDPWASVEVFNNSMLDKIRYSLGADYSLQKKHVFGLYYRYQRVYNDDEEGNTHYLGMSYKFKF